MLAKNIQQLKHDQNKKTHLSTLKTPAKGLTVKYFGVIIYTYRQSRESKMFIVKRCVRDYEDVFKHEVAEFATEAEADAFVEVEERCSPFNDVWFEVDEQ
jgi:hypothetical protein